jgi:hypothetical protein
LSQNGLDRTKQNYDGNGTDTRTFYYDRFHRTKREMFASDSEVANNIRFNGP